MSLHRALLLLALSLRLGAGAALGQEVQGTVDDRQRTIAAEAFAGAVAHEGTEDFVRAFRLGLEAAYKLDPVPGVNATRSLSPAPPRAGVEADSRYQQNLDAARKESTAKIWGGKRTKVNSFPDVVAVLGGGALCTGTLIAPDVVLTAAHCYCANVNENIVVGLDINDPASQLVKVKRSEAQVACDQPPKVGDLALLFLEKSLSIAPRRLAQPEWIDAATSVHLVGFGRTEDPTSEATGIQREVDVVVASSNCAGTVSTPIQSVPDSSYYDCTKGRELVAGRPMLDRDSCNGDSGGPALVKGPDGQLYLAAATSRAVQRPGLHACGDGGIYARTDGAALDWIRGKGVAVGIGLQASLSSSFRMAMKLRAITPISLTSLPVDAAPPSASILAPQQDESEQETIYSPLATTSVDDIRPQSDFPIFSDVAPAAQAYMEAKPASGSPMPSAERRWKSDQAKVSQYLKTLPKKTVEGTIEQKQDGTLVLSPAARPDIEIPLANSGDFSAAVAGPPVQVQLDTKSPDNVRADKIDLSLLGQWKKSAASLPRARFETVHRAVDNLAATSNDAFRSDAGNGPSASQQDILVKTQELEREIVIKYASLTPQQTKERLAFVADFKEARRTSKSLSASKAVFGRQDIYRPEAYKKIFENSRSALALAVRDAQDPYCSGVLVAKDLVLTAQHCVDSQLPTEIEARFNYEVSLGGTALTPDTYPVEEILASGTRAFDPDGPQLDFALLRLGLNASGKHAGDSWPYQCLSLKRVRRDDALYVVGHPQGYPRVVHDNAFVYFPFQVTKFEFNELKLLVESEFLDDPKREERMAEFTSSYRPRVLPPPSNFTVYEDFNFRWGKQPTIGADADTYHGDSGSPVFSRASHLVVGIFFAGEADLDTPWNPGWAAHEAIIPVTAIVDQLDTTLPSWRSSEGVCVKN